MRTTTRHQRSVTERPGDTEQPGHTERQGTTRIEGAPGLEQTPRAAREESRRPKRVPDCGTILRVSRGRSRALVVASAVCFGTTGTAQAFAPDGATPLTVGAARLIVGAAMLIAATTWLGHALPRRPSVATGRPAAASGPRAAPARSAPSTRFSATPRTRPFWLGAVGVAVYQPAFFLAVTLCGVGTGTVVALGSAPVITGVLAWAVGGRRPNRRWAAATALAVTGVVALTWGPMAQSGPDGAAGLARSGAAMLGGIALAIAAGAGYAVYTLAAKSALDAGADPARTMAWLFGGGALLLSPALALTDASWLLSPRGAAIALWLGIVTTGVAYLLFAAGLRGIAAAEAATLTLAEPATAAAFGVLLLGEPTTAATVAGMALIAGGLLLIGRSTAPPAAPGTTGDTRDTRDTRDTEDRTVAR